MAGRKHRKADGVAGFIAGAISDRQKAQAQTQRLEARTQLAWAKENAAMGIQAPTLSDGGNRVANSYGVMR